MKTKPQAKSVRIKNRPQSFTFQVKQRLLREGDNISALAKRIDFARNTVSRTINHPTIHPEVRKAIVKELNLEVVA